MLNRQSHVPVRRTDTPPFEDSRVEVVGQDGLAEVRVREHAAEIAAARPEILHIGVQEIAVGHEIPVRVGPGPGHARRAVRGGRPRHPQRGIGVGIIARYAGALQVLAKTHPEGRLAGAKQVVRHAHPRRDILVAVDAARFRNDDGRWQESRRPFLLSGEPAPGPIEPDRAVQRQATARPLLLHEQTIPGDTRVVHPR